MMEFDIEKAFNDCKEIDELYPKKVEIIKNALHECLKDNKDVNTLGATFLAMASLMIPIATRITGDYANARRLVDATLDYIHFEVLKGEDI